LRSKQEIRAIVNPLTEPRLQRYRFIEQRPAAMRIKRLNTLEGAFKTCHGDLPSLVIRGVSVLITPMRPAISCASYSSRRALEGSG
jgi:hypothetical protein